MNGRLDTTIVTRALAPSRTRAQRLIASGAVRVNGMVCRKPAARVDAGDAIAIDRGAEAGYVSRGAVKLLGALDAFHPAGLPLPCGRLCLDIGASTGGFSQVLLRHGASRVIALDVGHGQLAMAVAEDPRVVAMSGVNIRSVRARDLPFSPDYVVCDVSFISLTLVIPVIARVAAAAVQCVALVKPQFEVGRGRLGKGGVVTDPALRRSTLETVTRCAAAAGFTVAGSCASPITGAHGNHEYLLWFHR